MPRKKPKIKLKSPANNATFPLGTTITIELEISDTNVPDDAVGLFFIDLAKTAKPAFDLSIPHTAGKDVLKVSFPHRPATRGNHVLSCLGWFKYRGTNATSPNSPAHNDKNVDQDSVRFAVT